MPPDPISPGSSADWLRYAKADLALAQVPLPVGSLYELLCFHAQQAAEKSLKAVLIHHGIEPPRTHNVETLIDLLPASLTRTCALILSARLTVFATSSRYPGSQESIDEEEYIEAVRLAQDVVSWAEAMILEFP
jgi:HEPN domain-containing protein